MTVVKQSDVIKIWDILHKKNTGDLGFHDLDNAVNDVCGIEMDVPEPVSKDEANPFSEEVDDFDKEESPEEDPDLPYDENPDIEEIQP
jgi:hypothetical protein